MRIGNLRGQISSWDSGDPGERAGHLGEVGDGQIYGLPGLTTGAGASAVGVKFDGHEEIVAHFVMVEAFGRFGGFGVKEPVGKDKKSLVSGAEDT